MSWKGYHQVVVGKEKEIEQKKVTYVTMVSMVVLLGPPGSIGLRRICKELV